MNRLPVILAAAALALAGASTSDATVIETKWTERLEHASGDGFLRVYVRRIELTPSTWTVFVGLTNRSRLAIEIKTGAVRPSSLPFTYWAGPGIWWSSHVSGGTGWPGAGSVLTHAARATRVRPQYPTGLGPGKSWFGAFSGSLAKVPKDRLLRIGFASLIVPRGASMADRVRISPLSTTHQFKLPRRIR